MWRLACGTGTDCADSDLALAGVTVAGTFHCRKSEGNSRELDVEFQYRIKYPGNPGNEDESSSLIVQSFKVC